MGKLDEVLYFRQREIGIQPDPNPSSGTEVGWTKKRIRVLLNQALLKARRGREPKRRPYVVMVIADEHSKLPLLLNEPRGGAMTQLFDDVGQGEAGSSDP